MKTYYNPEDLKKFGKITDFQKPMGDKFFSYYAEVFKEMESTNKIKTILEGIKTPKK